LVTEKSEESQNSKGKRQKAKVEEGDSHLYFLSVFDFCPLPFALQL